MSHAWRRSFLRLSEIHWRNPESFLEGAAKRGCAIEATQPRNIGHGKLSIRQQFLGMLQTKVTQVSPWSHSHFPRENLAEVTFGKMHQRGELFVGDGAMKIAIAKGQKQSEKVPFMG